MATFITQRDAAITAYQTLIYPNSVGAIDGQVHQDSGVGQLESAYQNLVGYDNYSYVIVRTGVDSTGAEANTSAQNGLNLLAAYNAAKILTPGGNPVSGTNRVAVLVPAGIYDLGTSQIEADVTGVDLIGLGDKKDVIIRSNDPNVSTIYQTADDVVFKNFTAVQLADTSATGKAAYELLDSAVFALTSMSDVVLSGNDSFTSAPTIIAVFGITQYYAGTFERVVCTSSLYSAWDGDIYGTWKDCVCDNVQGWAVVAGAIQSSARFERCIAGGGFGQTSGQTHGGTYIDCETANGFGGGGCTLTGYYKNCKASSNAFGFNAASVQGTFIGCQSGFNSFGWNALIQGATMIDCVGGDNCFGPSDAASVFQNCKGGNYSFNSSYPTPGTLGGTYTNCTGGDYSFGGALISVSAFTKTLSGKFYNCVGGVASFGGQNIPTINAASAAVCTLSGEFYGCAAGDYSFGTRLAQLSGTFVRCSAKNFSFGCGWESSTRATMSGEMRYCDAGNYSFGVSALMNASGVFNYCKAGSNSFGDANNLGAACASKFYNCVASNNSWTYASTSAAEYVNCTAGSGSFGFSTFAGGLTLAGKYVDCNAGTSSFGAALATSAYTINLSGTFIRCSAGDNSFSFQTGTGSTSSISGKMYDCKAGASSFAHAQAGSTATIASGAILDNCTAGDGSFASLSGNTKIGELKNCRTYNYLTGTTGMASDNGVLSGVMRDCLWTVTTTTSPALNIAAGAKIYGGEYRAGATATRSIVDSAGLGITASLANVMVNQIVDPLITNNITSPNVIVDTDI